MLAQLLNRPETVSTSVECRVYERQSCDVPAACAPAALYGNPEARWEAAIRDLSLGGARLVLRRRFEPGAGLAIELPGEDEPYTVLARVIHVRRDGDNWALGCKFISPLSESELERLVNFKAHSAAAPRVQTDVRFRLLARRDALIDCHVKQFISSDAWPLAEGTILRLKGKEGHWNLPVRVVECLHQEGAWNLTCELTRLPSAEKLLAALAK